MLNGKKCDELQRELELLKEAIEESSKDYHNKEGYEKIITLAKNLEQHAKGLSKSAKRWKKGMK